MARDFSLHDLREMGIDRRWLLEGETGNAPLSCPLLWGSACLSQASLEARVSLRHCIPGWCRWIWGSPADANTEMNRHGLHPQGSGALSTVFVLDVDAEAGTTPVPTRSTSHSGVRGASWGQVGVVRSLWKLWGHPGSRQKWQLGSAAGLRGVGRLGQMPRLER